MKSKTITFRDPVVERVCNKFVKKMGAQRRIIAVVGGIMKAIIGKATIGIPKPNVPLTRPPASTAKIITKTIEGSLYIVCL